MHKQASPVPEETSSQSRTSTSKRDNEHTPKRSASDSVTIKRMTVALPAETAEMLELLSEVQSISLNEAVRRAISTEAFIQTEIRKKSRVLIETEDGATKELVFR